jgi:hypothetical protein
MNPVSANSRNCCVYGGWQTALRAATRTRHFYTLKRKNVEVKVAPATVIVCVPAIETLIAVCVPLIEMLVAV